MTLIRVALSCAAVALSLALWAPPGAYAACSNAAVRSEQGSSLLSECRGWEQVSPQLKNGYELTVPGFTTAEPEVKFQPSEVGSAEDYTVIGALPGSKSDATVTQSLGDSAAPGTPWSTVDLAPESRFGQVPGVGPSPVGGFAAFSPQLTCGVMKTRLPQAEFSGNERPLLPPETTAEEAVENLYEINLETGKRQLITDYRTNDPALEPEKPVYEVDGMSADCQHVIYEASKEGYDMQGAPSESLYEWSEAGKAKIASVLPDGTPSPRFVKTGGGQNGSDVNSIWESGSEWRYFFAAESDGKRTAGEAETHELGDNEVYMRLNGSETIEVSAPDGGTATSDTGAVFEGASSDGTRVYFVANYGLAPTSSVPKTPVTSCFASPEGGYWGQGCDLYEYHYDAATKTGTLTDLSPDVESAGETDAGGASVRGVLGISSEEPLDGTGPYVYFSASGQLIPGKGKDALENETGEELARGANLYAYHAGKLSYVATIGETEAGGGNGGGQDAENEFDAIAAAKFKGDKTLVARVSPNGQFALLATHKRITGYDNENTTYKTFEPELYEYHYAEPSVSGKVVCVSCAPDGKSPVRANEGTSAFEPLGPYEEILSGPPLRSLLNDGRVFFDSYTPLVSTGADGGQVSATLHAYVWRPAGFTASPAEGEETCTVEAGEPANGGCVALLDSGEGLFPSYFAGSNAAGSDVYVTTPARLALQDEDGSRDIYDVRVGGGIKDDKEVLGCQTEGCQEGAGSTGTGTHASEAPSQGNPGRTVTEVGFTAPPPAPVKIVSHRLRGSVLTLVVKASAAGKIVVSGADLVSVTRTVGKAGNYTLTIRLTSRGRTLARRRAGLRTTARVTFKATSGSSSASLKLTFR